MYWRHFSLLVVSRYAVFSLLEGAALDASASLARGDDYRPSTSKTSIVWKVCTIATQAGVTPVKYRRLVDIIGMCEPVPVLVKSDMLRTIKLFKTYRLVAFVTAFVSESLLVRPYKVSMPGQKKTITMYIHGLVYMNGDEVIVTRLSCCSP